MSVWTEEVRARLEEAVAARSPHCVCRNEDIRAALGEIERLRKKQDVALDAPYTTSCGHTWTMRHTACPTCFGELKAEIEQLRVRLRNSTMAREILANARAERAEAALRTTVHDLSVQIEEDGKEERALRAEVERLRAEGLADAENETRIVTALETEVERLRERLEAEQGASAAWMHDAKRAGAEVEQLRADSLSSAPPYYRHWQEAKAEIERLREDIATLKNVLRGEESKQKQWEKRHLEMRNDLIETAKARDAARAHGRTLEEALRGMVEKWAKHSGLCVPVIDGKMGKVTEESCVCDPLHKQARAALAGEGNSTFTAPGSGVPFFCLMGDRHSQPAGKP